MDPTRNPYNPGAGQQPPELAGRDTELGLFDVELHRGSNGRAVRGLVLSGLRGVGKTVLLNAMRSRAMQAGWATAKLEARPGVPLQAALAGALRGAVREVSRRARNRNRLQAISRALSTFGVTAGPAGVTVSVDPSSRAQPADFELDLTELFGELASLAAEAEVGVALFMDEMQDVPAPDLVALCGAAHEMSQTGQPLLVVGAGLPNLPVVLASARSYAERLFNYLTIDRLGPEGANQALLAPAAREGVTFTDQALTVLAELADGYPYFVQQYGKATWDAALSTPITAEDVAAGRPEADRALDRGFFGSRYERATSAERVYLHAMARLGDGPVSASAVARARNRPRGSTSAARDALRNKGLIYVPQRGLVAFTVPHFAAWLRRQDEPAMPAPRRRAAARTGTRGPSNRPAR